MDFFIAPASTSTSSPTVAANHAQTNTKATEKNPERDVINMNIAYVGQVDQMVNGMLDDQESRRATIEDLFAVTSALKYIDQEGGETLNPDALNRLINLDLNSPARDAGADNP